MRFLMPVLACVFVCGPFQVAGARSVQEKPKKNKWEGEFLVGALGGVAIQASFDGTKITLQVSRGEPKTITLNPPTRPIKKFGEVVVGFFDGFPMTTGEKPVATGEGFKGRTTGGSPTDHFGYWIIITVNNCEKYCFIQLILKSSRVVKRDGKVIAVLADKTTPELDEGTIDPKTKPCGEPNFMQNPSPKKDGGGFFDAPGVPGVAGDVLTDKDGKEVKLQKGDVIEIDEMFRTFIRCGDAIVGFVDWGWKAKITVGDSVGETKFEPTPAAPTGTAKGDEGFDAAEKELKKILGK
jgi:hypothetical protein